VSNGIEVPGRVPMASVTEDAKESDIDNEPPHACDSTCRGRGTPTGRTPVPHTTPLKICRCGHSNWEHKRPRMQGCTLCLCPSFIDERAPTPGNTTGGGCKQCDVLAAERDAAIKREGEANDEVKRLRAELAITERKHAVACEDAIKCGDLAEERQRDAREARERAIRDCMAAASPDGAHAVCVERIRALLAPVPTAEAAKEPTDDNHG
jgi:hypothetical protein